MLGWTQTPLELYLPHSLIMCSGDFDTLATGQRETRIKHRSSFDRRQFFKTANLLLCFCIIMFLYPKAICTKSLTKNKKIKGHLCWDFDVMYLGLAVNGTVSRIIFGLPKPWYASI